MSDDGSSGRAVRSRDRTARAASGTPGAGTVPDGGSRSRPAAEVQQFYGRWTGLYDLIARYSPRVRRLRAAVADELDLRPGDTVVDVGCGTGANAPYLRERVGPDGTVVGVDVTGPMLRRARRTAAKNGWENVHFVRGDGARLPVEGPVDAVVATFVVGMFEDPAAAVDGWCDLVDPGGRVAMANLAPSDRPAAGPLNAVFRVLTALSTPPTRKLRYEESLLRRLRERVVAGEDALMVRGVDARREQRLLGYVRVASAGIPDS